MMNRAFSPAAFRLARSQCRNYITPKARMAYETKRVAQAQPNKKTVSVDWSDVRRYESLLPAMDRNLRALFEDFDRDDSGSIDVNELIKGLQSRGISVVKDQADSMIREATDENGIEKINYENFERIMKTPHFM